MQSCEYHGLAWRALKQNTSLCQMALIYSVFIVFNEKNVSKNVSDDTISSFSKTYLRSVTAKFIFNL